MRPAVLENYDEDTLALHADVDASQ